MTAAISDTIFPLFNETFHFSIPLESKKVTINKKYFRLFIDRRKENYMQILSLHKDQIIHKTVGSIQAKAKTKYLKLQVTRTNTHERRHESSLQSLYIYLNIILFILAQMLQLPHRWNIRHGIDFLLRWRSYPHFRHESVTYLKCRIAVPKVHRWCVWILSTATSHHASRR